MTKKNPEIEKIDLKNKNFWEREALKFNARVAEKPKPEIEKINLSNKEFWKGESAKFNERVAKNPQDAEIAARRIEQQMLKGDVSRVDSMEDIVADLANSRSAFQSKKAKNSRPKKTETHKNITIVEMRKSREYGRSLEEFLGAAEGDGMDDGLQISLDTRCKGVTRYLVSCNALEEPEQVAKSTLEGWWAAAGKKKS